MSITFAAIPSPASPAYSPASPAYYRASPASPAYSPNSPYSLTSPEEDCRSKTLSSPGVFPPIGFSPLGTKRKLEEVNNSDDEDSDDEDSDDEDSDNVCEDDIVSEYELLGEKSRSFKIGKTITLENVRDLLSRKVCDFCNTKGSVFVTIIDRRRAISISNCRAGCLDENCVSRDEYHSM
jgi:hypothetical protein